MLHSIYHQRMYCTDFRCCFTFMCHMPANKTAMKAFRIKHEGQLFGRPPLLYLDPGRRVPDLLLRSVSHLYWHRAQKHCICKMHIDKMRVFMIDVFSEGLLTQLIRFHTMQLDYMGRNFL